MRLAVFLLSFFILFTASAHANMTPEQTKKFMDTTEENLNLKKTIEQIEKGEIEKRKLQIIYLLLQNNGEYYVHNLNGASGNEVYEHKDGHKEAVYDSNGDLVKDGINDASYNYHDRTKEPLRHFSFDTHPWIIWGASKKDTTSPQERITGLANDLGSALMASLQKKESLSDIKSSNWDRDGQLQAVAIIYLALENEKSDTLYSLFDKDSLEITRDDITNSVRTLELGLNKVYKSN
jgi:hypothetical protein